jgi:hypothetical protein
MTGFEPGRRRVRLWTAALIVAGLCVAGAVVAHVVLLRIASPEAVSSRLGKLLNCSVQVRDVTLRPWMMEARLDGLSLGGSTQVESVALRFDAWAAVAGRWHLRAAEIAGVEWIIPGAPDQWDPFLKGALSPMWLARHADSVKLRSGTVLHSGQEQPLVSAIQGEFSKCENVEKEDPGAGGPSKAGGIEAEGGASPSEECFVSRLRGLLGTGEEFSVETRYTISESGDSLALEALKLTALGLDVEGGGFGTLSPRPKGRVDLSCSPFFGGTLGLSARMEDEAGVPSLKGKVEIKGADAKAVTRHWFDMDLLQAGTLYANIDLVGRGSGWWDRGLENAVTGGRAELDSVVVDTSGPLAALIPLGVQPGAARVEKVRARFEISDDRVVVREFSAMLNDAVWRGAGDILKDGRLAGLMLGRVPVTALGGGGSALMYLAGLLSDDKGRVPVAFRVGGTVARPLLNFDLDAVVEEAAKSGRPEARSLLRAMSRKDRERLARTLDELLLGTAGR